MKIEYLIDTNIFILLFNNRLTEPIPNGSLGYSVITEIELLSFPQLDKAEEQLIRSHLAALQRIPLDTEIAQKTITLRRQHRLKTPDAIIVASAMAMKATLITNDQQLKNLNVVATLGLEYS
ncbi:type II toxin-antitoxin system VapC family toxin [Acaryochloris sp. CCMEE 5410]|uniref:type II toxin-antitoxin system VapC family toxin n=1 Tax=Acaryochloris sp. CCMEE 5410 TaxID=310037 RepID=UPI0002485153|nr:type II toxin-antitoxin system VapC family toxin [Acaryochloris sp. CCMEE 5410]KAI9130130.1 type II toxin-antitoxin system VapC family toxin [Acaryochloris sp. CCMEE 5410]